MELLRKTEYDRQNFYFAAQRPKGSESAWISLTSRILQEKIKLPSNNQEENISIIVDREDLDNSMTKWNHTRFRFCPSKSLIDNAACIYRMRRQFISSNITLNIFDVKFKFSKKIFKLSPIMAGRVLAPKFFTCFYKCRKMIYEVRRAIDLLNIFRKEDFNPLKLDIEFEFVSDEMLFLECLRRAKLSDDKEHIEFIESESNLLLIQMGEMFLDTANKMHYKWTFPPAKAQESFMKKNDSVKIIVFMSRTRMIIGAEIMNNNVLHPALYNSPYTPIFPKALLGFISYEIIRNTLKTSRNILDLSLDNQEHMLSLLHHLDHVNFFGFTTNRNHALWNQRAIEVRNKYQNIKHNCVEYIEVGSFKDGMDIIIFPFGHDIIRRTKDFMGQIEHVLDYNEYFINILIMAKLNTVFFVIVEELDLIIFEGVIEQSNLGICYKTLGPISMEDLSYKIFIVKKLDDSAKPLENPGNIKFDKEMQQELLKIYRANQLNNAGQLICRELQQLFKMESVCIKKIKKKKKKQRKQKKKELERILLENIAKLGDLRGKGVMVKTDTANNGYPRLHSAEAFISAMLALPLTLSMAKAIFDACILVDDYREPTSPLLN